MLTARYSPITIAVPSASESGRLRCGLRTSPAVNVMLFQASAANNAPTWAMQRATSNPNPVSGETPGAAGVKPLGVPESLKFRLDRSSIPSEYANTITANRAPSLADVNVFCTILPYRTPRLFVHVSSPMRSTPTSCAVEREIAYLLDTRIGAIRSLFSEMGGHKTPR